MKDSIRSVVLCVVCFIAGYVCVSMLDSKPAAIEVKPLLKPLPIEAHPIPLIEPLPLVPMRDWSNIA